MTGIIKQINTNTDIRLETWGVGLTHDNYLVRFWGGTSSDLKTNCSVQAVKLTPRQAEMAAEEIEAVQIDRYQEWGEVVGKYWPIVKEVVHPKPPCICDGQHSIATGPDDITGHKNDAGGYCCPHHGNTCGCHPEYS